MNDEHAFPNMGEYGLSRLRQIRALIALPEKYIPHPHGRFDAMTSRGKPCTHRHSKAYAFSLCGAWYKTGGYFSVLTALSMALGDKTKSMSDFGRLPHSEILALIDMAIDQQGVQS